MTNWSERIEHILKGREEASLTSWEIEQKRKRDEDIQQRSVLVEDVAIEILQKTRDIWKGGSVQIYKPDTVFVHAALDYTYEGMGFWRNWVGGKESIESGHGYWRDCLRISPGTGNYIGITDYHKFFKASEMKEPQLPPSSLITSIVPRLLFYRSDEDRSRFWEKMRVFDHGWEFAIEEPVSAGNIAILRTYAEQAVLEMCAFRVQTKNLPSDFLV